MRNKPGGFTLVELMVVVAVIGILAAIAYPSYMKEVQRSRRSAAEGCLTELSQYMERYYTTKMTYDSATLPSGGCRTDLQGYYSFAFTGSPDATTYTIVATATGGQSSDACGNLGINQAGDKTPTTGGCWRK